MHVSVITGLVQGDFILCLDKKAKIESYFDHKEFMCL